MILHVDMDAFYASVEERENPVLRGKPLIVGGSPRGRGVVSAANYAARKFGVHSAMPTSKAARLCPQATIVRPRMQLYAEISHEIRAIFARYTPEIEPLSLDEAFLDVHGTQQLFGDAVEIGRRIKAAILSELQLVASVGVAPNKFLAKLASDLEKPDGFTIIAPERIQEILDPLEISRIWGVGRVTQRKFEARGITTFGQLRMLGNKKAQYLFGPVGEHFWRLSQGLDSRRVVSARRAKSISHETTFAADVEDSEVLLARLLELTEQVGYRLRRADRRGKTVNLKVRYSDFHTVTRAQSLAVASNATNSLWKVARELFESSLPETRKLNLRLIGMGVSNLQTNRPVQLGLFDDSVEQQRQAAAQSRLDAAADSVREKFGKLALQRASVVGKKKKGSG
ncbi:MAG: DNA polymerase IV [Planctomycetota bacterium]|nr:DNA polymerase IV [Planctomycetota bacterium]